ncbi:MAG: lytic transglycosylase domain-containing protein [Acidimicrobiia bacterium]
MSIESVVSRVQSLQQRLEPSTRLVVPLGVSNTTKSSGSDSSSSVGSGASAFSASYARAMSELPTQSSLSSGALSSGSAASGAATASGSLDWSVPGDEVPVGTPYAEVFTAAARRNGLSPKLLAAVGQVESNYRTDAVSPMGAQGLMQFMPATAAGMGVDPWNPDSAIDGAARLLAGHLANFGSIEAALAAYNTGSGTVARNGGRVPVSAQSYVDKVLTRAHGGNNG